MHEQYFDWGVVSEEVFATRRAVLRLDGGTRRPNYRWNAQPDTAVEIAPGTEVTLLSRQQNINGIESYPVTWADDPYPPDSANAIQAYLPVSWVEYVYGEQ